METVLQHSTFVSHYVFLYSYKILIPGRKNICKKKRKINNLNIAMKFLNIHLKLNFSCDSQLQSLIGLAY